MNPHSMILSGALGSFGMILAVAVLGMAAVAWVAQRRCRDFAGRKLIWQGTYVALLAWATVEATGVVDYAVTRLRPAPSQTHAVAPALAPRVPPTEPAGASPLSVAEAPRAVDLLPEPFLPAPAAAAAGPTGGKSAAFWVGWIWLMGLLVAAGWLGVGRVWWWRGCRRWRPIEDLQVRERFERVAARIDLRRRVRLLESAEWPGPVSYGLLRPRICLPWNFGRDYSPAQQEVMLAHEAAHLAGLDPAWYALADLVAACLWWHPAAWWMRRQLHAASEGAADEASLLVDNGPETLAECLVALGRRISAARPWPTAGLQAAGFRSGLGRRVSYLLGLPQVRRPAPKRVARLLWRIAVPVGLVVVCAAAAARTRAPELGPRRWVECWNGSVLGCAVARMIPSAHSQGALGVGGLVVAHDVIPASQFVSVAFQNQPGDQAFDPSFAPAPAGEFLAVVVETQPIGRALDVSPAPDLAGTEQQGGRGKGVGDEKVKLATPGAIGAATAPSVPPPGEASLDASRAEVASHVEKESYQTRWFKLETNSFLQAVDALVKVGKPSTTPASTNRAKGDIVARLQEMFEHLGVDLAPPAAVFFNPRLGHLMVRVKAAEMETVEQAIGMLSLAPPQVTIQVKLCEYAEDSPWAQQFESVLGQPVTNVHAAGTLGILTDPQFRVVLRALEQQTGVDLLSAPKVTTLSGRQAQVKTVDVRYVVTDLDVDTTSRTNAQGASEAAAVIQPVAEPVELGPVVDVLPQVAADGYTIHLTATVSIKEFFGYDNREGFQAYVKQMSPKPDAKGVSTITPLPRFRVRQVSSNAAVFDGQTLVMAGGTTRDEVRTKDKVPLLGDMPLLGRFFRRETKHTTQKRLVVFVTPRLVDPAGNPVHADAKLPFPAHQTPTQSASPQ